MTAIKGEDFPYEFTNDSQVSVEQGSVVMKFTQNLISSGYDIILVGLVLDSPNYWIIILPKIERVVVYPRTHHQPTGA